MRFGKLLAAVAQKSKANEPYVSYKELKHNLSTVCVLCGQQMDLSSAEDGADPPLQERPEAPSCSASSDSRIAEVQQDFFKLLQQDITAVKLYVQSNVSGIEAMIGEWQVAAVKAGLAFTPQQLEEVRSRLPVYMEEEALVEWLLSLTVGSETQKARYKLVDQYSETARLLNSLLQYIEVNLCAVRKILKKYLKKIPVELRTHRAVEFKAHHELFMPSMQQVLVTAVQMQRLIAETLVGVGDAAVPISQLGPESLAVLSTIEFNVGEVFNYGRKIDVYAKPAVSKAPEPVRKAQAKPVGRPQQVGLVSKEEEGDEVEERSEELPAKSRRRGRKRGPRKEEKAEPRPQGKGKAKGEAQEAGPMPCGPMGVAPMVTGVSYPRYAHVFPGVPVIVPKAHGEPLVIAGGPRPGVEHPNWISMAMMWPQNPG